MIPLLTRFETLDDALWNLGDLQRAMGRLPGGRFGQRAEYPAVNVWSNQEKAVLTAELPGVDPSAINIAVLGDTVTFEGERKAEEPGADAVLHRHERRDGQFSRSVRLPFEVTPEKVTARYDRGILEVILPRHESTKPRKITVSGE